MAHRLSITCLFTSTLIFLLMANGSLCQDRKSRHRSNRARDRPNIVIIMTDDQDSELGSMNYMPKTLRIMQDGGAKFPNAFTNSPICCPSRSSFLTGLHVHNHNVWTNNVNCSSEYWQTDFEPNSFASYLQNAGYRTGYFGKYLNEYTGTHIPPGWKEWMGLVKNSAFYNYTVNYNGQMIRHGDDYHKDYFTDLIANDSLAFFKNSLQNFPNKPVTMVLSMPAPHGPEDSAPQYNQMFTNVTDHRTPAWNYAPNPDKELLLQITGKMEPIQSKFSDLLMRKRIMTLQSVDDAVEKVYNELRDLGELNNTYMIYISDHGYHLGQFGIPKGKSMPYDFDTKIPLYIRGPGVKPGSVLGSLVGIIDIAPTLLDIAQVELPEQMDGKSLKPILDDSYRNNGKRKAWRDTFLIERGKLRKQLIWDDEANALSENFLPIYFTKTGDVKSKCDKPAYRYPCRSSQKFYCYTDKLERSRIRKCNKLTERCACDGKKDGSQRVRRDVEDDSYVQKCSIVDGSVQCARIDNLQNMSFTDQRQALDKLIGQYRQQLNKLKKLRKDIQQNFGKIDYNDYQPLRDNASDSEYMEHIERLHSMSSTLPPPTSPPKNNGRKKEKRMECWCASEEDLNGHELDPKDLVIVDEEAAEEAADEEVDEESGDDSQEDTTDLLTSAIPDLEGLSRRELKRLERQKKRDEKKQSRKNKQYKECDEGDRKCVRRQQKKGGALSKRNNPYCQREGAECSVMDNDHWRTEPLWTDGPFCFCNNAQSNVFWCLRVMNDTHNFLYCEYINDFLSYYDLNEDPWQLKNAIHDLSYQQLGQLHELLIKMRTCKGAKECTYRHREKLPVLPSKDRPRVSIRSSLTSLGRSQRKLKSG